MTPDDLLDETVEYANVLIDVATAQESARDLGKLTTNIARYYRAMGIYDLLIHAHVDGFHHALIQSGLTRRYYLDRCALEGVRGDPDQAASLVEPLLGALAADQPRLAAEIHRLQPVSWLEGYEYEDDFVYGRLIGQLADDAAPDTLRLTLGAYDRALRGDGAPRRDVCEALVAGDQDLFDEAFETLVAAYVEHVDTLSDPQLDSPRAQEAPFPAERAVFVEGLGLLRLAERRGLETQPEYDRCPSLARRPMQRPFRPDSFPNQPL